MKTTHTNPTLTRIVTTCLALLIALILAVPAHAEIELEPDAFTGETASSVSSTAPAADDGDPATSEKHQATASRNSANSNEQSTSSRDSNGLTLSSLFGWLRFLPIFGG